MSGNILIIEDTAEITELLSGFLTENGYNVTAAADGNEASRIMRECNADIILMDLMLPYKSGEELIKELRTYSQTPVIVVSAKSMLETKLEVLRTGADDYILKPFDLGEVLVRIEVVMRRTRKKSVLSCGGLLLDTEANSASVNGSMINLTSKELSLLTLFMKYPKKVFTKANLYESVWNEEYCFEDNTINVHISNLRNKLKNALGRDCIETVWGIGYRLSEEKE